MEPFIHWIVSTALLLAIFPKLNRKWVLLLSPLSWIADFDKFIPGYHRIIFYNIFFFAIAIYLLYKFLGTTNMWIGIYFLLGHLLFDLSFPGVALFWPLIKNLYYFDFDITYDHRWIFDLKAGSTPIGEGISEPSYYLYTQGTLIIILTLTLLGIYWYQRKKQ